MREVLCQIAIISEKQQALGLCIQASDIEQPRELCGQQIENSVARSWISPGRNEPAGLMQHDGEQRGDVNKFSIHFDVVPGSGFRAEVRAGFAVNRHPAFGDQLVTLPA